MKFEWNTDKIVSLSAMAVGVGSLVIILYQTKLMRESQHASVMPYLAIVLQSSSETANLGVRNTGIGPALLQDVRVRYKGKDFVGDPYDFFVKQRPDLFKTIPTGTDKLTPGRLVPAGEWIQNVSTSGPSGTLLTKELLQLFVIAEVPQTWLTLAGVAGTASERAVIIVTYSSVYGDQWHLRSDSFVPVAGPAPAP